MAHQNKFFQDSSDNLNADQCEIGDTTFHPVSDYQLKNNAYTIGSIVLLIHDRIATGYKFRIKTILNACRMSGIQDKFNGNILVLERIS